MVINVLLIFLLFDKNYKSTLGTKYFDLECKCLQECTIKTSTLWFDNRIQLTAADAIPHPLLQRHHLPIYTQSFDIAAGVDSHSNGNGVKV